MLQRLSMALAQIKAGNNPKVSKEQILEKLRNSLISSKEEIETKGLKQAIKNTRDSNDALSYSRKLKD